MSMVRWPLTYFVFFFWWGQTWCSCPCLANPGTIHLGRLEAERSGGWWLGRVDFSFKKMDSSRLISPWTISWPCEIPLFFWKPGGFYEKNLWFLRILVFISKAAAPSLKARKWSLEALKPKCLMMMWWTGWFGLCSTRSCERHTWASWWNFLIFTDLDLHFRYCMYF